MRDAISRNQHALRGASWPACTEEEQIPKMAEAAAPLRLDATEAAAQMTDRLVEWTPPHSREAHTESLGAERGKVQMAALCIGLQLGLQGGLVHNGRR